MDDFQNEFETYLDDYFESGENVVEQREKCTRCVRPSSVCLCAHIATPPIRTKARVLIIQHPSEIKRPLRTVPLLEAALEDCHVVRCRKGKGLFAT
jgi:DTW domain-containing protein YfiP